MTLLRGKGTLMCLVRCGAQQHANAVRRFACYAGVLVCWSAIHFETSVEGHFFAAAEAEENTQTQIVNEAVRNAMQHASDQADRELVLVV